MSKTDITPSPSEILLAALLAELDRTPPSCQQAVVERYLRENPEHAAAIQELVDADAGVRPTPGADSSSRRLRPGQRLGPFRIVRFVAHGGMGEVYEAVQDVLDRRVALKVIRNGFVSPTARARFLREQQVLAKLHQTNIVPVHHAGEEGDLQYCAMQFVDGASLHKVVTELYRQETSVPGSRQTPPIREVVGSLLRSIPEGPAKTATAATMELSESKESAQPSSSTPPSLTLSPSYFSSAAAVMIQVAEAAQHGHDHNICHRDIKPSNLIIDSTENCWVIDYGLASAVNAPVDSVPVEGVTADPILTQGPLGTPQYMAPEQFEGKTDPRSDVWSLGVTLYELLTLRPAFRGDSWAATKEHVTRTEPESPRELVRNVPADLAAVCRKAMAKNPADRYASAQAFAADLRRWTHWEPTAARPGWSTLRPLRLWAWRKKAWAATAVVVLVATIAGWIVEDARAKDRIAYANAIAEEQHKQFVELQQEQARQQAILEAQQIRLGEPRSADWSHKAMTMLEESQAIRPGDDLRDLAVATLIGLDATLIYDSVIPFQPKLGLLGVGRVTFSPDGTRVLAAGMNKSPALLWDGNIANKPTESTRPGAGPVAFPDADSPLQLILPIDPRQPLTLWNVGSNAK
ncbi:MAG TPA: serine/threonine-protein kinase, partial [Gemmata sp.]|nr:serine/threonine-protein kinase [Gemmata sp.]